MKKVAICGAGIIGVSTAYYLKKQNPSIEIVLLDKHQPLSFTSSKSGENFRDYWPHPAMEALCSHSIELMRDLHQSFDHPTFDISFSGYHFVSHEADKPIFSDDHSKAFRQKNKVILDSDEIANAYPYLDDDIKKSIFINNAGNVDSITMANLMLTSIKGKGFEIIESTITDIDKLENGFKVELNGNDILNVDQVVIATGPFLNDTARHLDLDFPVWNTLQRKFIFPDPLNVIAQDMPFTIYADSQYLAWSDDEISFFNKSEELKWMTQYFPGAIHIKPESGNRIKMGWAFSRDRVEPHWEIPIAEYFPQVVLKGASKFIPGLSAYAERIPTPLIEYGGYYNRTQENWPLIGPTGIEGAYVVGAMAGFGTMAACASGELCANYINENRLPEYAQYFHPNRYSDSDISKEIEAAQSDGQL